MTTIAKLICLTLHLLPACYRHKGIMLGYGLKFWPGDFETLKKETPQLGMFAEGQK